MRIKAGNPLANFTTCAEMVKSATSDDVDLIVFPELAIPGYLIGDRFEELDFIEECEYFAAKLCSLATSKLTIVFGSVARFETISGEPRNGFDGRPAKLNVAYIATDKGVEYRVKTLLPNYREFEEPRHFRDNRWVYDNMPDGSWDMFKVFDICGKKLGITICEDGWDSDYSVSPIAKAVERGADMVLNLSCSPFTLGKNKSREKHFGGHAAKFHVPIVYVNAVGIQNNGKTIFGFDGSSEAWNRNGEMVAQARMYQEILFDVEYKNDDIRLISNDAIPQLGHSEIEDVYATLKNGISLYMEQSGLKRVVIGASGGIDSAVAAAMYVEAIGPENVMLVNMPTRYNSQTTIGLAEQLAANLGCYFCSVPIEDSVSLTKRQIDGLVARNVNNKSLELKLSGFNMENVQARDRSSRVLAAIASAWGGVFTNNGNKTEISVGYASLYGDVAGFFAVLGDLWKYRVYALGRYVNSLKPDGKAIPDEIFSIVPSAELNAEQSLDKGKGDPIVYPYHDRLFASWQEWWNHAGLEAALEHYLAGDLANFLNQGEKTELTEELIRKHFPTVTDFVADLEYWWKQFKGMAIAKRVQAPPIMAVTRRAYGFDYRESMCGVYFTSRYLNLKSKALSES